jgi:hypothetical protein
MKNCASWIYIGRDSDVIKPDSLEYQTMDALKSRRGIVAADFQSAMNQLSYGRDFGKESMGKDPYVISSR